MLVTDSDDTTLSSFTEQPANTAFSVRSTEDDDATFSACSIEDDDAAFSTRSVEDDNSSTMSNLSNASVSIKNLVGPPFENRSSDKGQPEARTTTSASVSAAMATYAALQSVGDLTASTGPGLIFLEPRRSRRGKAWRKIATVPTRMLYQWFESQTNDFSSKEQLTVPWVNVIYVGHPGDSPRDISARPFFIDFAPSANELERSMAMKSGGVVLRHYFECMGLCEAQVIKGDKQKAGTKRKAASNCATSVKLMIEVDIKDSSRCRIFQRGHHPEAEDVRALRYSRRLRLHLIELGARSGTTAARLKKELLHGLDHAADSGATPRIYPRPNWRLPSAAEVERLMAHIRQASRLHADPFVAVETFVQGNSARVFAYQPLKVTKTKKQFSIGIKSSWSLQNLIRFRDKPVYLDSSWRNKNENRAPLTFVSTTNAADHMVPAAAFLSADATSSTYAYFLETLAEEFYREALSVCDQPSFPTDHQKGVLLAVNARLIVSEGAWRPACVMIDKSRAELNAIKEVWPAMHVRVCQFHIIQAICRWDTDSGSAASRPPGIARRDKPAICTAFREAQRCRDKADWPVAMSAFETSIREALTTYSSNTKRDVIEYFRKNWWATTWHSCVTDIGLLPGQTRDNMNTNNTSKGRSRRLTKSSSTAV